MVLDLGGGGNSGLVEGGLDYWDSGNLGLVAVDLD